ncbi:hypothetical protein RN001_012517 [Aquatica leii]|uniref:Retrotransposon gag domain-containing protein n=1 Tax=Aquatica leii TaxID=1421715 RepID=A0AAN7Q1P7_9COLE|nr:hypothetical protein RN001_012517 [Aquatica leii]
MSTSNQISTPKHTYETRSKIIFRPKISDINPISANSPTKEVNSSPNISNNLRDNSNASELILPQTTMTTNNVTLHHVTTSETIPILPKFVSPTNFIPGETNPHTFLRNFNRCASSNHWNNLNKISFFANYLEGNAYTWFSNYKANFNNVDKTWEDISTDFLNYFEGSSSSLDATDRLKSRKQLSNELVIKYYFDFIEIANDIIPQLSCDDLVKLFRDSLQTILATILICCCITKWLSSRQLKSQQQIARKRWLSAKAETRNNQQEVEEFTIELEDLSPRRRTVPQSDNDYLERLPWSSSGILQLEKLTDAHLDMFIKNSDGDDNDQEPSWDDHEWVPNHDTAFDCEKELEIEEEKNCEDDPIDLADDDVDVNVNKFIAPDQTEWQSRPWSHKLRDKTLCVKKAAEQKVEALKKLSKITTYFNAGHDVSKAASTFISGYENQHKIPDNTPNKTEVNEGFNLFKHWQLKDKHKGENSVFLVYLYAFEDLMK